MTSHEANPEGVPSGNGHNAEELRTLYKAAKKRENTLKDEMREIINERENLLRDVQDDPGLGEPMTEEEIAEFRGGALGATKEHREELETLQSGVKNVLLPRLIDADRAEAVVENRQYDFEKGMKQRRMNFRENHPKRDINEVEAMMLRYEELFWELKDMIVVIDEDRQQYEDQDLNRTILTALTRLSEIIKMIEGLCRDLRDPKLDYSDIQDFLKAKTVIEKDTNSARESLYREMAYANKFKEK